jgi:hypothetical protein
MYFTAVFLLSSSFNALWSDRMHGIISIFLYLMRKKEKEGKIKERKEIKKEKKWGRWWVIKQQTRQPNP